MMLVATSVMKTLDVLSTLLVFVLFCCVLLAVGVFLLDRMQSRDAILRNYPLIGHMRYVFSALGEFFRQYFFAMDREELPFNRAERNWIDRASKNCDSTVAFGSTKYIKEVGATIFVNCAFPTLEKDIERTPHFTIGRDTPNPYEARSFFNISGMSFGALSAPAVLALEGRQIGGLLAEHRRGRPFASPSCGRRGHRLPDWHGQIRRPQRRREPERGAAARGGGIAASENVRDQAFAGRKARQGRHPAGRQSDRGNRGDPRNPGRRGFDQPQSSP
jgi:hypothetical protein